MVIAIKIGIAKVYASIATCELLGMNIVLWYFKLQKNPANSANESIGTNTAKTSPSKAPSCFDVFERFLNLEYDSIPLLITKATIEIAQKCNTKAGAGKKIHITDIMKQISENASMS